RALSRKRQTGGGMAWHRRWWSLGLVVLLAGCASNLPDWAQPRQSLAGDMSQPAAPHVVRFQVKDETLKPMLPQIQLPPPPIAAPAGFGPQQVSYANRGQVRVRVRAWVNGRPIFEDEVMQAAGPEMRRVYALPDSQRGEKMAELFNTVI